MKQKIAFWTAALILCLTLISSGLTCGMYARYTTAGTGSDRARVAKFGQLALTMQQTQQNGKLLPGQAADVVLDPKVTMTESEVAVVVYVYVTLPEESDWRYDPVSRSFTCGPILWTVEEGWEYLEEKDNTYTFYQILPPGESLADVPVVQGGIMHVPGNYDNYYGMTNAEINLNIRFKAKAAQID